MDGQQGHTVYSTENSTQYFVITNKGKESDSAVYLKLTQHRKATIV